jgi:hypothetical protein
MILEWMDIYSKNLRVWSMGLAEYLVFVGLFRKSPSKEGWRVATGWVKS